MAQRPELTALDGEGSGVGPDFDPAQVPAYPLVRAQIRQTPDGDLEGVVDDLVVASDVELEPVRAAVIAAAAKQAAKRGGPVKATRVRGVAPDESVFHLVVTAAGDVFETTDPNARPTTSAGGKRPGKVSAKPAAGRGRQGKEPTSVLFILAVVLVPALIIAAPVGIYIAGHAGGVHKTKVVHPPAPVQLPVVPPGPYSDVARWSINLGTSAGSSAFSPVTADADRVYAVRDSGANLAAYAASNGLRQWKFSHLDGNVAAGPALVTVGGKQRLALASTSDLVLLDPATGAESGEWDLPDNASGVQMTATGPLALTDAGHAQIVAGGQLVTRVIPATGTPVAPTPDGALIVAGPGGQVWTVRDSRVAQPAQTVPAPSGTSFVGVAGWTGRQLVLVYHDTASATTNPTGSNAVRLAAYTYTPPTPGTPSTTATQWRRDWVSGAIPTVYATGTDLPLRAAPGGAWGIYGTSIINLTSGAASPLPDDWQTSAIGDVRAFGLGGGRPLTVTPSGVLAASTSAPSPPASTTLVGPQASAGTAAYVVASANGTDSVLYALRLPKNASSAVAPTTTTAPAPTTAPAAEPSTTPKPHASKPAQKRPATKASSKPHTRVSSSKPRSGGTR